VKINEAQPKVLVCKGQGNEETQTQKTLHGDTMQRVNEYKYLRSKITEDGRTTREIVSRIIQVECVFQNMKNMFISRNIRIKVRRTLLKTYVWSIALYGSETMDHRENRRKRLLAFEPDCNRLLGISWTEHITNEEETRSFPKTLKTRRANLIGHILRHNSLLGRIIEWGEGNSRGRPPLDYISQMIRDMGCRSYCELKKKTEERQEWRIAENHPLG